ncbi:RNA polymerase sigma factor [Acidisoma cellulosilytica]|uniref:RNA polymerase sigma factor n=1 Tax=Acidisoma cellulosilyticum TaxID=2802395 RepID=A0A963Z0R3_9PROT|nr:RNA polymerase sigma factor [Acidisoma cellulosilyticum]MCB8879728.1 RNA polymerase sigma factor [Acidisoma cellulosilyticum]
MTESGGPGLARLAALYQDELRAHARRQAPSAADAEDMVQDAWARFAVQDQGAIANIRAFLHRILDNLSIDHRRRTQLRARYHVASADPEAVADVAEPAPTVEARLIDADRQRAYQAILASLPARCREALILSRIEGWPHTKIARHLGVSANTVTADIRRAMDLCLQAAKNFDV